MNQSIIHEIEAVKALNEFLVKDVCYRIREIDSRLRGYICSLAESGVPIEVCNEYEEKRYEAVDQVNFRDMYKSILESHLPRIRSYINALIKQLAAASSIPIDNLNLSWPEQLSETTTTSQNMVIRNQPSQDYIIQIDAVCDLMDFLVDTCRSMNDVIVDYRRHRSGMIDSGVPRQIWADYEDYLASPLERHYFGKLIEGLMDDFKYLRPIYNEIADSLRGLGYSYVREPKAVVVDASGNISIPPTGY